MQTAAAQLPSQKGGGTGPRPGNGRVGQDLALIGGPEQPETVQVATAVCQQVAAPLALAAEAIPFDAEALADELRNLDLEVSAAFWLWLKRALDLVVSAAALLALLPLFVVIAAMIKLTDGGSIFFAQRRVGFRGQTFRMLKFRSMVVHAERLRPRLEVRNESNGPVFKR